MQMFAEFPIGLLTALVILTFGTWTWRDATRRANSMVGAGQGRLHSLPGYHGWYGALWVVGPALSLLLIHDMTAQGSIRALLQTGLSPQILGLSPDRLDLFFTDARKIAFGGIPSATTPELTAAAASLKSIAGGLNVAFSAGALLLAGLGFFLARSQLGRDFRARNAVEACVRAFMIVAAAIAILTTAGIVLSLLFETLKFFSNYNYPLMLIQTNYYQNQLIDIYNLHKLMQTYNHHLVKRQHLSNF